MKYLLLSLLISLSGAQQDLPFFQNLSGKDAVQKRKTLEKRIDFDSRLKRPLTTFHNVTEYFKLTFPVDEKLEFLFRTMGKSSHVEFVDKVLAETIRNTGVDPILQNMQAFQAQIGSKYEVKLYKLVIKALFDDVNLDTYIKNRDLILKMGQALKNQSDQEIAELIFTLAYRLNLQDLANYYLAKINENIKNKWNVRHIYCYFLININQADKAKSCFKKIPNVWGNLGSLYIEKLEGGNQASISTAFSKLQAQLKAKPRFLVYEYFLTGSLSPKSLSVLKSMKWDYQNGFLMLLLNQKYKKISRPVEQKMQRSFFQKFPTGYLAKILRGELSKSQLKVWFGEKSIFNQSSL